MRRRASRPQLKRDPLGGSCRNHQTVVIVIAALILTGGFLLLRPLLLRLAANYERRLEAAPIPAPWLSLVEQSIPLTRHLTNGERTRLLHATRELITTRHWEGCGGLVLSHDMQVIIAAQACLLTLAIPGEPFPGLRDILVYPGAFVPRRICDPRKWLATAIPERPAPELGEAWSQGVIVLGWEAALTGATNAQDGRNVVLHEFAHELSFEHHLIPAVVSLATLGGGPDAQRSPTVSDVEAWLRVLQEGYERLCATIEAKEPSVLDPYAATNLAEFFAVATEAFFERSRDLSRECPELYDQLRTFYGQDPANVAAA